jgi:predicted transcriptional regulator
MNKSRMLSFRLDAALLRKVDLLRIARHRTRGEIIREALELYFRAHSPIVSNTTIPLHSIDQ